MIGRLLRWVVIIVILTAFVAFIHAIGAPTGGVVYDRYINTSTGKSRTTTYVVCARTAKRHGCSSVSILTYVNCHRGDRYPDCKKER